MNKRNFLRNIAASSLCLVQTSLFAQQAKEAPVYYLKGTDAINKKIDLEDFKGKTVLVSFFTAGCSLCSRDLKQMRDFYAGNAKRNFIVLAVNLDQDKKDYDTYNQLITSTLPRDQQFPIIWRNAPDHKDNFGTITRRPTHFVINPKGQFVFKREGTFLPNDWDTLWDSLGT